MILLMMNVVNRIHTLKLDLLNWGKNKETEKFND